MDKKRLTCKVCGFKSDNLVPHIETEHPVSGEAFDKVKKETGCDDSETALYSYMIEHDAGEADVVCSDVAAEPAATPTPKRASKKGATVASEKLEISGVELPKGAGGEFVPKVDSNYHFGTLAGDVCQDILEQKKVMLIGHTGCGKSSLIEQLAAKSNQGCVRMNMNGQTTIGDFVGLWVAKGGELVWVDGFLPKAMREGLWLIVDEIDCAEASILSIMQQVTERNGKLVLKEKGHEIITPHKDFRLFATANAAGNMSRYRHLYQGTNLLNEAFLDRWRVYKVDYLSADEEAKIISGAVPKINLKIATVIVRVGNMVREAFKKEEVQCTFSLRRMIDWAELMVRHKDPVKAAEMSIFAKISDEDGDVVKGIIARVMIGNKTP